MTLKDSLTQMIPLLLKRQVDRIDKIIDEPDYIYEVKAYWAGTIIRIDIKPKLK